MRKIFKKIICRFYNNVLSRFLACKVEVRKRVLIVSWRFLAVETKEDVAQRRPVISAETTEGPGSGEVVRLCERVNHHRVSSTRGAIAAVSGRKSSWTGVTGWIRNAGPVCRSCRGQSDYPKSSNEDLQRDDSKEGPADGRLPGGPPTHGRSDSGWTMWGAESDPSEEHYVHAVEKVKRFLEENDLELINDKLNPFVVLPDDNVCGLLEFLYSSVLPEVS